MRPYLKAGYVVTRSRPYLDTALGQHAVLPLP
jgi:hypothetical protein